MKRLRCQWCSHPTRAFRIPSMRKQSYDMPVGSRQDRVALKIRPLPVFEKLYKVGRVTLDHPTTIKRVSASGVSIVTNKSPADFTAFSKRGCERFARVRTEGNNQTERGVIS